MEAAGEELSAAEVCGGDEPKVVNLHWGATLTSFIGLCHALVGGLSA